MKVRRRCHRRVLSALALAFVVLLLLTSPGPASARASAPDVPPDSPGAQIVPRSWDRAEAKLDKGPRLAKKNRSSPVRHEAEVRINVGLEPGVGSLPDGLDLAALGLRHVESLPALAVEVLALPLPSGVVPGSGLQELSTPHEDRLGRALQALRAAPGVAYAEQDRQQYRPVRTPNDPMFSQQWGAQRVGLPAAWDLTVGSASVTVAVVDTGIHYGLPEFQGRLVSPYSVQYDSQHLEDLLDIDGHGTGVAAVAAAQGDNGFFIAGAAWGVNIMPVHLTDDPAGCDDLTMAKAIQWASSRGADVINISFAGSWASETVRRAVNDARALGIPVVAAAGNQGPGVGLGYPGAYPGVITVGATDGADRLAGFSQTGDVLDVAAPGVGIVTYVDADPNNTVAEPAFAAIDGTSFAAPLVSGVVALMLSINPALTPDQIENILARTSTDLGVPGRDPSFGHGLLDARRAVEMAATPPSTRFPDVPTTHPYFTQIEDLARRGIILGKPNGNFEPDAVVVRQQFAKMIVLSLGLPVSPYEFNPFSDVGAAPPGSVDPLYPDKYVAVCAKYQITKGTKPGQFSPWDPIRRAQLFTMVGRSVEGTEPPPWYQPPFANFHPEHYLEARRMYYWGLLYSLGVGSSYDFWRGATRGEVAAVLYNMLQAVE
jgi:subtilisin family serine protease